MPAGCRSRIDRLRRGRSRRSAALSASGSRRSRARCSARPRSVPRRIAGTVRDQPADPLVGVVARCALSGLATSPSPSSEFTGATLIVTLVTLGHSREFDVAVGELVRDRIAHQVVRVGERDDLGLGEEPPGLGRVRAAIGAVWPTTCWPSRPASSSGSWLDSMKTWMSRLAEVVGQLLDAADRR